MRCETAQERVCTAEVQRWKQADDAAEPGRGRAVVSGEDAGGWDAQDDEAPGEISILPGHPVVGPGAPPADILA